MGAFGGLGLECLTLRLGVWGFEILHGVLRRFTEAQWYPCITNPTEAIDASAPETLEPTTLKVLNSRTSQACSAPAVDSIYVRRFLMALRPAVKTLHPSLHDGTSTLHQGSCAGS